MKGSILTAGTFRAQDGNIVAQAVDEIEGSDIESVGEVDVISQLGVSAAPYPKTDAGAAELVGVGPIGGRDFVALGGRDTRAAEVTGNLKPGDTTVHTTHPNSKAQWQCCGELNQCVGYLEDSDGETMLVQMDGKANTLTLAIPKQMIVMQKGEGIMLTTGGATIKMTESGEVTIVASKLTVQTGTGVPMFFLVTANPQPLVGVSGGPATALAGAGTL